MKTNLYIILLFFSFLMYNCSEREDIKEAKKTVVPDSEVDPGFKKQMAQLIDQYFELKKACVNNDHKAAKGIAVAMKGFVNNKIDISVLDNKYFFAWSKQHANLDFSLSEIIGGKTIENTRLNFQDLYTPMYKLLTSFGMGAETVYVQFCPMAFDNNGAKWISEKEQVTNPYFGDKMMECGANIEVISFK